MTQQIHRIVIDAEETKKFIDWLPDLTPDECYYVCLFARNKYYKPLKADKAQLKRLTSNKERLLGKLLQLECPVGAFTQDVKGKAKNDGEQLIIPQEALAVYITPNPRSNRKASINSLKKIADLITIEHAHGYNLHQEVMSELQKARSRSIFRDFDFDDVKWEDVQEDVLKVLNPESFVVLNTRGGFHLLVESDKVLKELQGKWFLGIKAIHKSTSSDTAGHGDNMIPIPGCTQGGAVPYMIYPNV